MEILLSSSALSACAVRVEFHRSGAKASQAIVDGGRSQKLRSSPLCNFTQVDEDEATKEVERRERSQHNIMVIIERSDFKYFRLLRRGIAGRGG
jgi:hypothetical protein